MRLQKLRIENAQGQKLVAYLDLPRKDEPLTDDKRIKIMVFNGADHMFLDFFSENLADGSVKFISSY